MRERGVRRFWWWRRRGTRSVLKGKRAGRRSGGGGGEEGRRREGEEERESRCRLCADRDTMVHSFARSLVAERRRKGVLEAMSMMRLKIHDGSFFRAALFLVAERTYRGALPSSLRLSPSPSLPLSISP